MRRCRWLLHGCRELGVDSERGDPVGGGWVLHVASLRRLLRWIDRRALRFRQPLGLEGSLGFFFVRSLRLELSLGLCFGRSLRLEPSLGLCFSLSGGFEGSLGLCFVCFGRRTSLALKGRSLLLYLLNRRSASSRSCCRRASSAAMRSASVFLMIGATA